MESVIFYLVGLAGFAVGSIVDPFLWLLALAAGLNKTRPWLAGVAVVYALVRVCFLPVIFAGPNALPLDWPFKVAVVAALVWLIGAGAHAARSAIREHEAKRLARHTADNA